MPVTPTDAELTGLLDRTAVTDTVVAYGATIDAGDFAGLRALFADDARARYGGGAWHTSADELVAWIRATATTKRFAQHLMSVVAVVLTGDRASAVANVHAIQVDDGDPHTADVVVGRYRVSLRRSGQRWLIVELEMEVGWRGSALRRVDG